MCLRGPSIFKPRPALSGNALSSNVPQSNHLANYLVFINTSNDS
jgi:hypothetical protein